MNEEAQLVGGTLVNLMEKKSENGKDRTVGDEEGFIETKWCRNRFVPFLSSTRKMWRKVKKAN